MNQRESQRRLGEAVRDACGKVAQEAYENAGISGLCEEGRWNISVLPLTAPEGYPLRRDTRESFPKIE